MKILFITDPITKLTLYKDTTFALMIEAEKRGYAVFQCEVPNMTFKSSGVFATVNSVQTQADDNQLVIQSVFNNFALSEFDLILMRKDPPFDQNYLQATFMLEQCVKSGVKVLNHPQSLRDCNEKLFTLDFYHHIPPLIVSSNKQELHDFAKEHEKVIFKPLDAMGGHNIFLSHYHDPNFNVIVDCLTQRQSQSIMGQAFLPEVKQGDKRILLIDGQPVDYALARIPQGDEIRGNLAVGGKAEGVKLTESDRAICESLRPILKEKQLFFVGIDVIGQYLTEINVTSPTCIREIDKAFKTNISAIFWDKLLKII